jgi:hypothetical protein
VVTNKALINLSISQNYQVGKVSWGVEKKVNLNTNGININEKTEAEGIKIKRQLHVFIRNLL